MHLKIFPLMILLVALASCAASKKQAVLDHYETDESWSGFVARFGKPTTYEVDWESENGKAFSAKAVYVDFAGSHDLIIGTVKDYNDEAERVLHINFSE